MDSSIIQAQLNTLEKDTCPVHDVHILILNFFETVLGEKNLFLSGYLYFISLGNINCLA